MAVGRGWGLGEPLSSVQDPGFLLLSCLGGSRKTPAGKQGDAVPPRGPPCIVFPLLQRHTWRG